MHLELDATLTTLNSVWHQILFRYGPILPCFRRSCIAGMKVDLLHSHVEVPDFTLFSQSAFLGWNLRSCLVEAYSVVDVGI